MVLPPVDCPLCAAPVGFGLNSISEPACCPSCGCRIEGAKLLLEFWERERMVIKLSLSRPITLETRLRELDSDSLVLVELVMLMEEEITVVGSEIELEALSQSETVRALLRQLSHIVGSRGD
ncbi:Acyl carrier protein [Gimesia maris]|uniref:phosphopantetheine-binding protein n=1 Tax=Gimesia maris TaxID=122 RepID=UPI00118A9A30|nr:phosphopantetheine-binding protein [Gimesia maris]QDT79384.1 Acyl carrier protein [Gimesia maris]